MLWLDELCDALAERPVCGYHVPAPAASEPTALTALALIAHGRIDAASQAADWLRNIQSRGGTVGIGSLHDQPIWPTSLALLAWNSFHMATSDDRYQHAIERAVTGLLAQRGTTAPRHELMGHDTTLVGWPWAAGTHSWLEPTALAVLALKSSGHGDDHRCTEALQLLLDRQLPAGGCNYGNTFVLGQQLLPHLQPTGLAMLALSDEESDPRVRKSLAFLQRQWPHATGTASLCYAALGLAAHEIEVPGLPSRLQAAYRRCARSRPSPHKYALLALAAAADRKPLQPWVRQEAYA